MFTTVTSQADKYKMYTSTKQRDVTENETNCTCNPAEIWKTRKIKLSLGLICYALRSKGRGGLLGKAEKS